MVKLRLKRLGRKKRPFYRIVAMTDRQPRSGQALAELGTYDPVHARFDIDEEAAISWLNNGAQMTPTVHDLLSSKGVLARWKGLEGTEREDALQRDKPKRRKKVASAPATPEVEAEAEVAAPVEAAEPVAEAAAEAPVAETAEAPVAEAAADETKTES